MSRWVVASALLGVACGGTVAPRFVAEARGDRVEVEPSQGDDATETGDGARATSPNGGPSAVVAEQSAARCGWPGSHPGSVATWSGRSSGRRSARRDPPWGSDSLPRSEQPVLRIRVVTVDIRGALSRDGVGRVLSADVNPDQSRLGSRRSPARNR